MPPTVTRSDLAQGSWSLFAHHRAKLTQAIVDSARARGGRLCLLGAGPCNDVDLDELARTFAEIHLVDIDAVEVGRAIAQASVATRARLVRHAPVDLSSFSARRLAKWSRRPPAVREIEDAATASWQAILARLPGPFEVVASTCVLTQMSFALRAALRDGHPTLAPARLALMASHLRTLIGLTASGGAALFASDLVSSTTYPLDELATQYDLARVMREVVERGAAYHAAHPGVIGALIGGDVYVSDRVERDELVDPWLWTGAKDRTYLVYAMRWFVGA